MDDDTNDRDPERDAEEHPLESPEAQLEPRADEEEQAAVRNVLLDLDDR
jgi:hypothetical protein